jgi:hypothetical protein
MKTITLNELEEILINHQRWLNKNDNWQEVKNMKAVLDDIDLSPILPKADEHEVGILQRYSLRGASLQRANLHGANLYKTDLSYANLQEADLSGVTLAFTDLTFTNLTGANLTNATIYEATIDNTNLSEAIGVMSSIDYLKDNFEFTNEGMIAYKVFNSFRKRPEHWVVEKGSILTENVNFNRANDCACGINLGSLEYIKDSFRSNEDIWKVLIRYEWLSGVVVPYATRGQIRCERCELVEKIDTL